MRLDCPCEYFPRGTEINMVLNAYRSALSEGTCTLCLSLLSVICFLTSKNDRQAADRLFGDNLLRNTKDMRYRSGEDTDSEPVVGVRVVSIRRMEQLSKQRGNAEDNQILVRKVRCRTCRDVGRRAGIHRAARSKRSRVYAGL